MTREPPSPSTGDRLRHRVASRFSLVVGVLVVVALLGGYVAVQTHAAPSTTVEQREVASWSSNASFDHEATVQRDTIAFTRGQTLENRPLYFARASPVLEGTYTFDYDGDAEDVDVRTDLRLVVQAIDRGADETTIYWNITEPLTTVETTDLGAGERHTAAFEVNVSAQQELANAVEDQLMASPGSREVVIVAETTGTASLAGDQQDISRTDELRVEPAGVVYRVGSEIQEGQGDTVTEQVEVPIDPDPLPAYGAPIVALLALAGALGLVYLDRDGRLTVTPATRRIIERDRERGRFGEWISAGRVVIDDRDRVVEMESLEDLVDVAIDANERVVYDEAVGWYVVLDGDVVYRYDEYDEGDAADIGGGPADETADGSNTDERVGPAGDEPTEEDSE